jgi:hypothetical protein
VEDSLATVNTKMAKMAINATKTNIQEMQTGIHSTAKTEATTTPMPMAMADGQGTIFPE